jgi:hypothetical protein
MSVTARRISHAKIGALSLLTHVPEQLLAALWCKLDSSRNPLTVYYFGHHRRRDMALCLKLRSFFTDNIIPIELSLGREQTLYRINIQNVTDFVVFGTTRFYTRRYVSAVFS